MNVSSFRYGKALVAKMKPTHGQGRYVLSGIRIYSSTVVVSIQMYL